MYEEQYGVWIWKKLSPRFIVIAVTRDTQSVIWTLHGSVMHRMFCYVQLLGGRCLRFRCYDWSEKKRKPIFFCLRLCFVVYHSNLPMFGIQGFSIMDKFHHCSNLLSGCPQYICLSLWFDADYLDSLPMIHCEDTLQSSLMINHND